MDEENQNLPPKPDLPSEPVGGEEPHFPGMEAPTPEAPSPPSLPETPPSGEEPKSGQIKKFFPIALGILFILLAGLVIFKFVLPRSQKPKEITLTYWGLWEPEEVMRGVIMEWEKDHPNVKINYSRQSPKEYRERLQSALARTEGPDIFRFHLTWVPMLKNELEPIPASVMSASQFEGSFYPVVSANLRSGTNYLGIPLMFDALSLYYNEDIFRAAGKNPPTSWEELRQLATQLTIKDENGRIQTAGAALGTTNNVDHWSDILGLMMLQNGADLANPAACTKRGDEEICLGADALIFYTIFNRLDRVWEETLPASTLTFAAGKLAMYLGPSWRVFDIKAINPNLNFKVVSAPQLPGTNITWATFWAEGVAQKSEHKSEAWEFLKFLASPQTLEKLYQAQSNIRLFGEIYPRVEMAEKLKTNPLLAPFINQAPNAQTWYLSSNTFDNGINDRMIKYFEDAVNAVNQGTKAKEALQTTAQGISQLLSQYGIATPFVR